MLGFVFSTRDDAISGNSGVVMDKAGQFYLAIAGLSLLAGIGWWRMVRFFLNLRGFTSPDREASSVRNLKSSSQ